MTTVKAYIHARLGSADRAILDALKDATGQTDSEIVRRGLDDVLEEAFAIAVDEHAVYWTADADNALHAILR